MIAAAIVVTHNSEPFVGRCLEPLLEAGVELWVVDNASADGTAELVSRRFPEARLLVNPDNRGFARAVNQALAQIDAEAVLLVNPDCHAPPESIRGLLDHLVANPDVGVVAPRLRDGHGRVAVSAHPFETAATVLASRFGGSLMPPALRRRIARGERRRNYDACRAGAEPVKVDWVSGACLAVRGDLLRKVGGLDEGYFLYYEDEELCFRARQRGARVVYLPSVEAVHLGGASSADPLHLWPHLYRSLLRFQAIHRPHTYAIVRAVVLMRALLGMALGGLRAAFARDRSAMARRARAWAVVARLVVGESGAIRRSAA
ncbi:MAG: glycosyltransferase family 2 protein [Actinomycetota bacterium]